MALSKEVDWGREIGSVLGLPLRLSFKPVVGTVKMTGKGLCRCCSIFLRLQDV